MRKQSTQASVRSFSSKMFPYLTSHHHSKLQGLKRYRAKQVLGFWSVVHRNRYGVVSKAILFLNPGFLFWTHHLSTLKIFHLVLTSCLLSFIGPVNMGSVLKPESLDCNKPAMPSRFILCPSPQAVRSPASGMECELSKSLFHQMQNL